MAAHFPIYLDLTGKRCLVVGGDTEARRKAAALRRAGAQVVSSSRFALRDLDGCALVMVAGADLALGEAVWRAARARGMLVNVADRPELCTFIMPAVIDRAPVTLAISTGGVSPALARRLRETLDSIVPRRLGALATLVSEFRLQAKRQITDATLRRTFWERILDGPVARLALAGEQEAARKRLENALAAETRASAAPREVA
ncbi:MAG: bifunctional precorrin-2 dehydrogenase/sirohydrochlorin ferrochelatase [Alphaproteobacteria bacterium]|nr:bifunctional precorrin-2 dehydrogenase/sirohydrochlorin ferrochelatase [Alphaproteobacteria bacterium]